MAQILKQNTSGTQRLRLWFAEHTSHPFVIATLLLVITITGAFLRLYKLGEWSFWGDEMFTISGQEDGFNYSLIRQSLSLALIQFVTTTSGLNEWNARIIPAVVGIISIPVLFFITKKLFDTPTALLSTLLLALSPWHLYWSQSARFYTTLLLFYSLALFFFYWGTENDKPWHLLLCLVCLGLATKERLLALFFLPVVMIYFLLLHLFRFEKPRGWNIRNLLIFVVPGAVGGLVFTIPYLLNLSTWFSGFGFANNSPFWLAGGFAYYIGLPAICMGGVSGVYMVAQKNRAGLLLLTSATLPILLLVMIAPFHYTANRYAFISLSSWLILAAAGCILLFKKSTESFNFLAIGSLLILLVAPVTDDALYYLYQNGNRDNWKAAFQYVHQHQQPGDLVASGIPPIANYYLSTTTLFFGKLNLKDINSLGQRVWFVEDMTSTQKYPGLHEWLIENAQIESIHDVNFQARNFSMRVYLYEPIVTHDIESLENGNK